jgi:hypothetical protein
MSALEIISDIEKAGVKIFIHNGGLRLTAASGIVTASMQARVKENKEEIINILSMAPQSKDTNGISVEDTCPPKNKQVSGEKVKDMPIVGDGSVREQRSPLPVPHLCTDCPRLEIVNIIDVDVPGCLYAAPGEYSDGWRRLPKGIEECLAAAIRSPAKSDGRPANVNRPPC